MIQPRKRRILLLALLFLLLTLPVESASEGDRAVPFDSEQWNTSRARLVDHLGRKALAGRAVLEEVDFADGVIEVDIAVTGARSYPGLLFRMESDLDHENFYIRPHILGVFETALQYTPVFGGAACWQLYNGPGFTAGAELPAGEWVTLRLEVSGERARIFLSGTEGPALEIKELKTGISSGKIGVSGPLDGSAFFSNFRYRVDETLHFEAPVAVETPPGTITQWRVSQSFAIDAIDFEVHPDAQQLGEVLWKDVTSERSGLVNLSRLVPKAPRKPGIVLARTVIHAETARPMELRFGYSDVVSIFHRGQLIFSGNASYRSRSPIFQGIVGLNDSLHLALEPGDNELLFIVGEGFGGWGLMARDGDAIFEHPKLKRVYESEATFVTPESVLYDPKRDQYYVTNFDVYRSSPAQHISTLGPNLELKSERFAEALARPLGMVISGDTLLIAEGRSLTEISPDDGSIVARHQVPGAVFLNDVALAPSGEVFISDSARNTIWRFAEDTFEAWLTEEQVQDPNALYLQGGELLVGNSGDSTLRAFDLESKQMRVVARFGEGIVDGIRPDGQGKLLVAIWEGRLYRVAPDGSTEKLLDLGAEVTNISDFEYLPEKKLLVLPTFKGNRIVAYRLLD